MSQRSDRSIGWALGLAGLDTLCIFLAFFVSAVLTRPSAAPLDAYIYAHLDYFAILVGAWYFQAINERLFVSRRGDALIPQLFAYTNALFLAIMFTLFVLALFHKTTLNRPFALSYAGFALLFMIGFRTTARLSVWGLRQRGYSHRRILMIGANARAARVAEIIQSQRHHGFQIVGFMDDDQSRASAFEGLDVPYLGPLDSLPSYLANEVVDVVYISLPIRSNYEEVQQIAHLCEGVGVSVRLVADLFPLRIATSGLSQVGDVPLLTLSRNDDVRTHTFVRRLVDMLVALILLIILGPLLAVIYVGLKLQQRGPAFVWQEYVSPKGRHVRLLKFRTRKEDDVVPSTPLGRVLERYSLDELPEFVNILLGQMSYADAWRGLRPAQPQAVITEP